MTPGHEEQRITQSEVGKKKKKVMEFYKVVG